MAIDYGSLNKGWVSRRKKLSSPTTKVLANRNKASEVVRKITVLDNKTTGFTKPITEVFSKKLEVKPKSAQRKAYDTKVSGLRF